VEAAKEVLHVLDTQENPLLAVAVAVDSDMLRAQAAPVVRV
jgi:hypothetical protein